MGVAMTVTKAPSVVAPRRALRSDAVHHRRRGHRHGRRNDRCRHGVVVRLFVGRAASSVVVTWGAFHSSIGADEASGAMTFLDLLAERRPSSSCTQSAKKF
jgi:hypothetical protein